MAIEMWERQLGEFENRTKEQGTDAGMKVSQVYKMFILLRYLVPKVLKDHIELNMTRFDTYEKAKSEILRYCEQKRSTEALQGQGAAPMEIGALTGANSSGCWNCGSASHYARDCKQPSSKGSSSAKGQ